MAETGAGDFDFDLFVIGGGSGGVRAARIAAGYGAKVAIAEEYRFGGTCVIRGCVPKKLMVYASGFSDHFEDAAGYGWSVGPTRFDWTHFRTTKDREIKRLEGLYRVGQEKAGVTIFDARATVAGPHEVTVDGRDKPVSARVILVAVGGAPFVPPFPGSEHAITSNEIFDLPTLPKRMLIAGGGYIACEFAGVMNGLGVDTTLIYRKEQILRGFDADLRDHVQAAMAARGVKFVFNQVLSSIEKTNDGLRANVTDGSHLDVDVILFATGRRPNTDGLGLETAGVSLKEGGAIPVDAWSRTVTPSIYAVGDVTDRVNLTPVAIREGHAFADTVFGAQERVVDHSCIPTAVFTQPEIGTVGLTEAEARAAPSEYGTIEIYRSAFRPMGNVLAGRDERMLMKLVVGQESRKVLGVHIAGHGAAEMAQCLGIAVKMGATKEDFDRTVAVHPTAAEELVTMRTPV